MADISLDSKLRQRVANAKHLNQVELARQMGRNQPWVNKFLAGHGHVTIDDWVRIARYFNQTLDVFVQRSGGVLLHTVATGELVRTAEEKQLLRAFRRIPPSSDLRKIALDLLVLYAKRARQLPPHERTPRPQQTKKATTNRVVGTPAIQTR